MAFYASPSGPTQPSAATGARGFATTPLSGSGRRFLARVIDAIVVSVITSIIGTFVTLGGTLPSWQDTWLAGAIGSVVYFLYEGLMLTARGQTLGKMALGIRVSRLVGDRSLQTGQAWGRAAVYTLPPIVGIGSLFWLIDVLWHLWDRPNRQCLHDKAATTVVRRL